MSIIDRSDRDHIQHARPEVASLKMFYMKKVFFIVFLLWCRYPAAAQGWQPLGPDDFNHPSTGNSYLSDMALDGNGHIYTLGRSEGTGYVYGNIVHKFDGARWTRTALNLPVSASAAAPQSLVVDPSGVPYVMMNMWQDSFATFVQKYNGTEWVNVGAAILSTMYSSFAIAPDGTPYVLYAEKNNDYKLTVRKYDGNSWVAVGAPGFSAQGNYSWNISISFNSGGTPYVAFQDSAYGNRASVMTFDGTSWVYVGTPGFSPYRTHGLSLVVSGSGTPYVYYDRFWDGTPGGMMKWNGTDWADAGAQGFLGNASDIDVYSVPDSADLLYVTYEDIVNTITVKKYDGVSWQTVGSPGFAPGQVYYRSVSADKEAVPYVAYKDETKGSRTIVKKFANGAWEIVGDSTLSYGNSDGLGIAVDTGGIPYMVFTDLNTFNAVSGIGSLTLRIKKHDGGNWIDVGAPLSVAPNTLSGGIVFDHNNVPYVAFRHPTGGGWNVSVIKFDGVNWVNVGSPGFSTSEVYHVSLTIDDQGTPYVALVNSTVLSVWEFDGSAWVSLGSPGSCEGFVGRFAMDIDHNGIPFIAFQDKSKTEKASVMKYNGTGWEYVGKQGFSPAPIEQISLVIDESDVPYVAYNTRISVPSASYSYKLDVRKLEGSAWTELGTFGAFEGANRFPDLGLRAAENGLTIPYVVYGDDNFCSAKRFTGSVWESIGERKFSAGPIGPAAPPKLALHGNKVYVVFNESGAFAKLWTDTTLVVVISSSTSNVVCKGAPVSFTAGAFNAGVNPYYQWRINGAVISGATESLYTSTTLSDNDVIDCIVTSSMVGSPSDTSNKITAHIDETTASITASSFLSCSGGTIKLSAGPAKTYLWSNGATKQSIMVSQTGDYSLSVSSLNGCRDTSDLTHVVITSLPGVKIKGTPTVNICDGSSTELVLDSVANIAGLNYQWKLNGSNIAGATGTSYLTSNGGTYVLEQSDTLGCLKTSAPKTVNVRPVPSASFSASGNNSFCQGGSVILQADTLPGYIYKWLRDGLNAGSKSYIKATTGGSYAVVAKLGGCLDTSSSLPVTVFPLPATTLTTSDPVIFCSGGTAELVASPSGPLNTYVWTKDAVVLPATGDTYITADKGVYKVTVTDANGCAKGSAGLKITVEPIPVATITVMGPTAIPAGDSVKLRASNGTGFAWQWYKDGNPIADATNRDYMVLTPGDYHVMISKGTCSAVSSDITITQTSLRQATVVSVSLQEGDFQLAAYPNPVSNQMTVALNGIETVDGTLFILDIGGRLIMRREIKEHVTTIDMTVMPAGTYILKYKDELRSGSLKLIKR